jgi:hypothetical protein
VFGGTLATKDGSVDSDAAPEKCGRGASLSKIDTRRECLNGSRAPLPGGLQSPWVELFSAAGIAIANSDAQAFIDTDAVIDHAWLVVGKMA